MEAEVHPITAIYMDDVDLPSVVRSATAREREPLLQTFTTEPEPCRVSVEQEVRGQNIS